MGAKAALLFGRADPHRTPALEQRMVDQPGRGLVEKPPAGGGERPVGGRAVILEVNRGGPTGAVIGKGRFGFEESDRTARLR